MRLKKYFIKSRRKQDIEAEEIFLDAEAIRSIEEKGKLEKPIKRKNFILFYILIIACLAGLFLRAGYLQVVKGEYYRELAQGNRLRIYPLYAPRGIIYDRQEQPLVYNIPSFDLTLILADFLDNPAMVQKNILKKISELIEQPVENLIEEIEKAKGQISQLILAKNIKRNSALILEGLAGDWPGIRLEKNIRRSYVFAPYFAHILGYTGQITPADLENHPDYLINEQVGKDGLEFVYDYYLRGQAGQEQTEVDALGKSKKILAIKPAQAGQGLVLFLDSELQQKLYQALERATEQLRVKKAVVLAMNPQNGGILAMVSLPSFDNNFLSQGISVAELSALSQDPNQPFLNRAVAGQYPPGSTIKPLLAAAALEEKVVRPEQTINCPGNISIINKYNPEIVYNFPDWKAHGITDIIRAIAQSCNVYFYTISGGYGNIEGLGLGRIKKYLGYFGLGQLTKIDLPYEESGLIPDEEWKKKTKPAEDWFLGDTYHLGIGQGDVSVTPLQIATAISAIANNGTLYQPQLVDKIVDSEKRVVKDLSSEIIRQNFIQLKNLKVIQRGMRQAVIDGSARALADLPVRAAGKTGTAQFGANEKTHAWFVGFAPYENPEIVLVILIEGGGEGSQAAVPVAKEVWQWYFSKQ